MFKIAVLMKQVPDLHGKPEFKDDGTLDRSSVESVCNPCDMLALEMALSLKNSHVSVLSMGPMSASEVLREGMYRGADQAILLSDAAFAGADTLATSRVLAAALEKIGFDLILCGDYSTDGGTSQVGPQVAELLGIPDIRSAVSLKRTARGISIGVSSGSLTIRRPTLVSVSDGASRCRPCNIRLYMKYCDCDCIKVMSARDLGLVKGKVGLAGSGTYVKCVTPVALEKKDRVVTNDIDVIFREGLL